MKERDRGTHGQESDGVDGQLVNVGVGHDGGGEVLVRGMRRKKSCRGWERVGRRRSNKMKREMEEWKKRC